MTFSTQPDEGANKAQKAQVVTGQFIKPGEDTPIVFNFVDEALHQMTLFLKRNGLPKASTLTWILVREPAPAPHQGLVQALAGKGVCGKWSSARAHRLQPSSLAGCQGRGFLFLFSGLSRVGTLKTTKLLSLTPHQDISNQHQRPERPKTREQGTTDHRDQQHLTPQTRQQTAPDRQPNHQLHRPAPITKQQAPGLQHPAPQTNRQP